MPCCKEHERTGVAVGIGVGILSYLDKWSHERQNNIQVSPRLDEALLYVLVGAVAGKIAATTPDVLEPATSPHHRNICHSVAAGTAIVYGMYELGKSNVHPLAKAALMSAGASCLAHIGEDAGTAMGVPWICR